MELIPSKEHPAQLITDIIGRIYRAGLTTTTGGNISIREENGDTWVTPSGIDKGSLKREDIICVKNDGTVAGPHKPSSEYAFHNAIFNARPDIRAVIHAHAPALVSFSIVKKIPNTNILPLAKLECGPVGFAGYAISGSDELGEIIGAEFKKGFNATIMENHGVVIGGKDLRDAYIRFESLEFAARTEINARMLGDPVFLEDDTIAKLLAEIPPDPEEMEQDPGNDESSDLRNLMSSMVRRACEQGLMIGSYGTVSVRLEGNDFLITPRNIPRWEMKPENIILIKDGKRESGKLPSRSLQVHSRIFTENPHVNSIFLAQPPYITSFGVSSAELAVRTIPESWFFLRDVDKVDFGDQFNVEAGLAKRFSPGSPAILIRNDSFIVTGDSLLQAFERLEVAEFTARSLVMGQPLGTPEALKPSQIDELLRKFG